jgi:hypothetical protein
VYTRTCTCAKAIGALSAALSSSTFKNLRITLLLVFKECTRLADVRLRPRRYFSAPSRPWFPRASALPR